MMITKVCNVCDWHGDGQTDLAIATTIRELMAALDDT